MTVQLPDLPYEENALSPIIGEKTVWFHYHKHHAGYVQKTNELIFNTPFQNKPLEEIVRLSAADSAVQTLFNNAAQVWNHNFYWKSLKPSGKATKIPDTFQAILARDFGSAEEFKNALKSKGLAQFGSGWVWLVKKADKLSVVSTPNSGTPLTNKIEEPLLVIDVWEHAYYLDTQNNRGEYLQKVIDNLLNWEFAYQNYQASL